MGSEPQSRFGSVDGEHRARDNGDSAAIFSVSEILDFTVEVNLMMHLYFWKQPVVFVVLIMYGAFKAP